jgi:hypothetical protein
MNEVATAGMAARGARLETAPWPRPAARAEMVATVATVVPRAPQIREAAMEAMVATAGTVATGIRAG